MAHEDLSQVLTDKFESASAMEGFFLYRFFGTQGINIDNPLCDWLLICIDLDAYHSAEHFKVQMN